MLCWTGRSGGTPVTTTDSLVVLLDGWFADPFDDTPGPRRDVDDAAVLARAWQRWGVDVAARLDGEFSALIYERQTGNLHVVRDPTGVRPLYWARREGTIAIASDLPALLDTPWVSRELARDHLAEYLAFRVVHPPRTLLRDVHQLPPGHRLRFSAEAVRVLRDHTPVYAAPNTPVPAEAEVVPELHAAIERAVLRRLRGRERIGVYLSGGAGSTSVTAAARTASRKLATFTVAFAEEPFPESPFAGRVARLLGMEHRTISVGSKDIATRFDDAVGALGHPVGNASLVLQHVLAAEAASDVDIVITGDGADQLFGGRMLAEPARLIAWAERAQKIPSPLRALAKRLLKRFADQPWDIAPAMVPLRLGLGGVRLFDHRQRRTLLLDELLARPDIRPRVLEEIFGEVETDPLNLVLHAFFRSGLCADILPRVDATAASAGLTPTYPLLDLEVQRLAQVLPGAFKVREFSGSRPTRWLLRAMLQGQLPPALIHRPDRGLPHPLDDWLQGHGRLFLEERVALLRRDPLELWHHTGIEALRRHIARRPGASHRLWALFIVDEWMRQVGAT